VKHFLLPIVCLALASALPAWGQTAPAAPLPEAPTRVVVQDAAMDALDQRCGRRPVGEVRFEGCAGTRCEADSVRERMRSLVGMRGGSPLRPGQMTVSRERLLKLGFFRSVAVDCQVNDIGQAVVTFQVVGHDFVRRLLFEGNRAVFTDELRGRAIIRAGDPLDADTPDGRNTLIRQTDSVIAVYKRAGFERPKVEVAAEPLEPGQVVVRVRIDEGERQRATQVRVHIDEPPAATVQERAAGLVCPPLTERTVREAGDVSTSEAFTDRHADKARLRVREFLRRLGYGNPSVQVRHDGAGTVRIDVNTGRCNLLRIFTRDERGTQEGGYELSDDRSLYEALPFGESGLFDFDEADRGREDLLAALANRGFLFAEVKLDYRPVPAQLSTQVETAITYWMTTGYVSQVRGIQFPGAHELDPERLAEVMQTKAYDFLDTGGFAQIDGLLADLDAIRQAYLDAGYHQIHYDLALPEGMTPTHANTRVRIETDTATLYQYRLPRKGFQIRKPHNENFIYVDIPVTEGIPARVGQVVVEGAKQVSEAEIRKLLGLQTGDAASYKTLSAGIAAVEERYRNSGFFRLDLRALCASHYPERAEGPCSPDVVLAREVDLHLRIVEGAQADVGEIFVSGNFATDEAVILRDMPAAGTPFSDQVLFDAQRRLRNLGIFSQVSLQYIGRDETPPRRRLAIVVQVVEAQNRSIEGAFGVQTLNTNRAPATRDGVTRTPTSAGEVAGAPQLIDAMGHLVSGADRLTLGFGQGVGLSLPNLMLTGEVAYVNRNFLHTGKEFRLPLKLGYNPWQAMVQCRPSSQFDTIGVLARESNCPEDPPLSSWRGLYQTANSVVRYLSLLPSYYDSRLGGSDFSLRLVAPYYVHDWAILAIDQDKLGGLAELARRFGKLSASVGVDGGFIRYKRPELSDFDPRESSADTSGGWQPQVQVIPRLTYDGTDSPLNPTRGLFITAAAPLINTVLRLPCQPGTAGCTSGYTNQLANFYKWEASAKVFVPIRAATLAVLVRAGFGTTLSERTSDRALPLTERFRLGGNFGLRGYQDYGLRQYDSRGCTLAYRGDSRVAVGTAAGCVAPQPGDVAVRDGNAVLNGSVELRFPLLGSWSGGLFWDWGAIAESWSDGEGSLNARSVRHSVGGGLRYVLAGQIPVRLDYGVAIDRRCRDVGVAVDQCTLDDAGNLHWSLLYAF
jgi:outer membrane protein assembly factor BamA